MRWPPMEASAPVPSFLDRMRQREAKLLEETLKEEKAADQKLTTISKTVNCNKPKEPLEEYSRTNCDALYNEESICTYACTVCSC